MTVRIGDTVRLKCAAVSEMVPTVYWEREGAPFPAKRTLTSGGNLTIVDVRKGDHGVYKCIASTANGKAAHATTIAVMCKYMIRNKRRNECRSLSKHMYVFLEYRV